MIRGIGHGYTNKVRTGCSEEERKKVWDAAVNLRSRAGAEKGRKGQEEKVPGQGHTGVGNF